MQSVLDTLDDLRKLQEANIEREEARNRPKATWFKFPNPRDRVAKVRFLQEFDPKALGYREDRGRALVAIEHEAPGPKGYLSRALCSLDEEGQCYPCEQRREFPDEGWRQKQNLYINTLVDYGKGEKEVVVLSKNFNSSFAQQLMDIAVNENTITDINYQIKATGTGTKSVWFPTALPKEEPFDDTEVEVYDLHETAVRKIPYEKQAEYYGKNFTREVRSEPSDVDSPPSDESGW